MAKASFHWDDPLLLDAELTSDERMVRDAAREYAQGRLAPRVLDAFRREHTDPEIFREMGGLGLLGATIPEEFGGGGLNYVSYGLIAREVERVDSGYPLHDERAIFASHAADRCASARLRIRSANTCPRWREGESIGCFGSDRARSWLRSRQHDHARARRDPVAIRLSGSQRRGFPTAPSRMSSSSGRKPTMAPFVGSSSRRAWKGLYHPDSARARWGCAPRPPGRS